jgi:hypothetical protein
MEKTIYELVEEYMACITCTWHDWKAKKEYRCQNCSLNECLEDQKLLDKIERLEIEQ